MTDNMVFPMAQQLLECLCDALATNPEPPLDCCIRSGDQAYADMSQLANQCCTGMAWVRISRIFPTTEFPTQTEVWTPCAHVQFAAELEMGVWRCEPQQDGQHLPTCTEWTDSAQLVANDWEAMVRAACCFEDLQLPGTPVLMGVWQPLNSGGGCTGGSLPIMVATMNCAC